MPRAPEAKIRQREGDWSVMIYVDYENAPARYRLEASMQQRASIGR